MGMATGLALHIIVYVNIYTYACMHVNVYEFVGKNTSISRLTAFLIIIVARYHDFNGFPVVNWY